MPLYGVILITIALSLIVFSTGWISSVYRCQDAVEFLRTAFFMAAFQVLFFGGGWFLAVSIRNMISSIALPLSILVIILIGAKVMMQSYRINLSESTYNVLALKVLTGLSVALGINAFLIGICLALIHTPIFPGIAILGGGSFILAITGIILGKVVGKVRYGLIAERLGGIAIMAAGALLFLELMQLF